MTIFETISRRISVRNFRPEPASLEKLEAIRSFGEHAEPLTTTEMRFMLCTNEAMGREIKGVIGDYGKTIHAPHFIVLAARERDGYLTDAGFRFEQMVLEATRNRLGTCWVGLMFKEASLRANLGLDESWRMIVITPIGYAPKSSVTNSLLRTLAGSKGRKPVSRLFFWERIGGPLPQNITSNDSLVRVMDAVRWAPSWMNRQPWRFVLSDREIRVYKVGQRNREGKDYHLLDCGIAMCHLHLAMRAIKMNGRWELATDLRRSDEVLIGRYVLEHSLS